MTDKQNHTLLSRLDDTPIGDPPVTYLLHRGHHLARRRRRLRAAGAATIASVAIGGSALTALALAGNQDDQSPSENNTAVDPADQGPPPTATGTRLVGVGQVMVSVPAAWGTGLTRCLQPVAPTVYFSFGGAVYCVGPRTREERQVSTLAVLTLADARNRSLLDDLQPAGKVGDSTVLSETLRCTTTPINPAGPGSCRQTFAVPDSRVFFEATVWGADPETTVTSIRESLQAIPDSSVAVPLIARTSIYTPQPGDPVGGLGGLKRTIEATGLRAITTDQYRPDLQDGSFLGIEPGFGTPVPRGTAVVLRVSTDTPE